MDIVQRELTKEYIDGAECLCDALIGSKRIRLGPRPTPTNEEYLLRLINQFVERGLPIETFTMWGGLKAYGLFDLVGPDFLDFMAFIRLKRINESVKRFYAPGVHFNIVREDLTEFILSNQVNQISVKMAHYHQCLCELARAMGLDNVSFGTEISAVLNGKHEFCSYVVKAQEYAQLIYNYCLVAEQRNFEVDNTPEADALREAGWHGGIAKCQWEHYLRRTESELPNAPLSERKKSVSMYLGNAMVRAVTGIFRTELTPIKLALMPHPPGVVPELYKGRVEFKIKDGKNNHNCVPPWAGFGIIVKDDWKQIGVREFREISYTHETADINGYTLDVLVA